MPADPLEMTFDQQQAVLDRADEQYNQAQVNLTSTQSSLQTTTASINAAKARLTTERSHLRADAVQAYMSDMSSTAVASLFGSPSSANQTRDFYQQLGSSTVAAAARASSTSFSTRARGRTAGLLSSVSSTTSF